MARSTIPPVTKLFLGFLIMFSLVTFILRYSTYLHIVTSETHDQDHAHLINEDTDSRINDEADNALPNPHELYVPLISLVPGETNLLKMPWVLFTTSFIEDGLISFSISFFLILYTGRYIEVLWGSREFFAYLASNILISNSIVYLLFTFKISVDESIPISPITGSSALLIALLVAIKQRIPNHYLLFLNGFIRLRVSLVPFFVLTTSLIFSFIMSNPYHQVVNQLAWLGFIISWVFLRFFKEGGSGRQLSLLPITESGNSLALVRGDRTGQFALSTFFPRPLSFIIAFISDKIFQVFVTLKLLNKEDFVSITEEEPQDEVSNSNTQTDLISQMSQSRLFTSSSLAGVSGNISTVSLPKNGFVRALHDKVLSLVGQSSDPQLQESRTLASRRKQALAQLDSKLSGP